MTTPIASERKMCIVDIKRPRSLNACGARSQSDAMGVVTEAVRQMHVEGRIPERVMRNRGGMVRHFMKPRGSRRKRRQYIRSCPGAMSEILKGMYED